MSEIELNIPSDYDKVADLNDNVREFLAKKGIETYIANAFEICLTEALNNVIKHAYGGSNDKRITVLMRADTRFVEAEIIDEGKARSKLEIPELDFDPQDINNLPESGMGLYIIKQLMDELDYFSRDGKNYFLLKKWLY